MSRVILGLCIAIAAGCGDKGGETATVTPTFTEVRDEILLLSCGLSSCHGSGTGGLTLDPGNPDAVYDALVNATADSGNVLVIPGDADGSYLVKKLEADPSITDDPMPPPFGLIDSDPDAVQRVRAWIDAGAPND